MATAADKKQYVEQWQSHLYEVLSVAKDVGVHVQFGLDMQKRILELAKDVEKVADILVEDGHIRA